MWFQIVLVTVLIAELQAYTVSIAPDVKFPCTRTDWTFKPVDCYIESHLWRGQRNVTTTELPCQPWLDDSPQSHNNHGDDLFPDESEADANNYCRDPELKGAPWCYTLDPATPWEFCDVPRCTGDVNVEEDVCTQCQCSYDSNYQIVEVECVPIVCPVCPGKVIEDGSCCGSCDLSVCVVDGIEYQNGEDLPTDSPCQMCQCVADGVKVGQTCQEMVCVMCMGVREDDGSCCGQCIEGCMVNDILYEDGEEFQDGCSYCQCSVTETGPTIECVGTACSINCDQRLSHMEDGACCPTCLPGCYDNVTDSIYQKDEEIPRESPCEMCYCRQDDSGMYHTQCTAVKCLPCEGDVEEDGTCCGVCHTTGCLYEGILYNDGDEVPHKDPCTSCTCFNDGSVSELMCVVADCLCPGRVTQDGTCCGICELGCYDNDQFYPDGEKIPSENPCVQKVCNGFEIQESEMMCEKCSGRWTSDGTCCGSCELGCFVDEDFYHDGDEVTMKNPCQQGFCHLGQLVVMAMACDLCKGRHIDDGTCCGVCEPGCMVDGHYYENGADIPMADPCSFGICMDGEIEILMMSCLQCEGTKVNDGTCCGQCIETTTTLPGPLPPTTTKEPECDPTQCRKLRCSRSLQFKTDDMCCPQCKCRQKREKYMPGSVGDKCDGCVCDGNNGRISCTPPTCSNTIECVDPVKGDDCCYSCPNGKNCLMKDKRKSVVLKYGDYYRTTKSVCSCSGNPWYPYAFCTNLKLNKKTFKDILPFFNKSYLDLGKN